MDWYTRKLFSGEDVTLRAVWVFGRKPAEDAAEEAEGAPLVGRGEVKAAEHESEVVSVGSLHVGGGVI